jgi:methyl-accepting chemotaxis protein
MGAGFSMALALGVLLARGITRPLRKGVAFARSVAQGDLAQRLDIHQRDEIGELAGALNDMAENLGQVMRDISHNAMTLAGASAQLTATSSLLASGAEETTA